MSLFSILMVVMAQNVVNIQNIWAIQKMMDNFEHKLDTNILLRGHIRERKQLHPNCQMHNGPSCQLVNGETGYQHNNDLMKNSKYRSLYQMVDSISRSTYNKVQEQLQENSQQNDFYVEKDRQRQILDQMRNNPSQIDQIAKQNNIHDYIEVIDLKVFSNQKYIYVRDDQYTYFSNNDYSDYLLRIEVEQHSSSKTISSIRFSKPVYIQEMRVKVEDYNEYKLVGTYKDQQVFYTSNKLKFGSQNKNMIVSDVNDIKLDQVYLSDGLKLLQFKVAWDTLDLDHHHTQNVLGTQIQQQHKRTYQDQIKTSQQKLKQLQQSSDQMINKLLKSMGLNQKQIGQFKQKIKQKIQNMNSADQDKEIESFRREITNQLINGDYEIFDLNIDDLGLDQQDINDIDEILFENL